ncbi:MAG: glycosyltransferase family 2 protein [Sphingomonas sp.]|nr:glycosyltransferase family 2 protein [Sphingomonas sp.]
MAAKEASVVIPTYNGAAVVGETLTSVRRQTFEPFEVIVVDDGSTDATPALLQRHADEDRRIRIVRQINRGAAAARNRGVAEARGTYVAFLDHDDLWSPTHLASQVNRLAASDTDTAVAYSWSCLIDMKGEVISPSDKPLFEGDVLRNLCRRNFIGNGSAGMVRKSALEAVGGFDESLPGQDDYHLYLKLAERFKFVCTREVSVGYRLVPGSMVDGTQRLLRSLREATAPFKVRYPEFSGFIEMQEKELVQWCCSRALYEHHFGDAAALIGKLAKLDPVFAAYSAAFVTIRPLLMRARRKRSQTNGRFEAIYSLPKPSQGDCVSPADSG